MAGTTTAEANKALIHRLFDEFVEAKNFDVLEETHASDFVLHGAPGGEELTSRAAYAEYVRGVHDAIPDFTATIEAMVAEDDLVAYRATYSGTHEGEFMDTPGTGKTFTINGMAMLRIEDGKITEGWGQLDTLSMLQQLGVVESPGG